MDHLPTTADNFLFQLKANMLRLNRFYRDQLASKQPVDRWPCLPNTKSTKLLSQSRSTLWDLSAPHAEKVLQAGKMQNLRVAARKIDGCKVPKNKAFSFWAQVGFPSRFRGYVKGRELRQGCLIPSLGGGLCQLSNALYDAADLAGLTILERHRHTQVVPGSLAEQGRDATVFWNYVDLRFKSELSFQIDVALTANELIVKLWSSDDT